MARGTSLSTLIDMLRAETRQSQDPALGENYRSTLTQTLQRTQDNLAMLPWPHMVVRRLMPISAGERFYALPDDMPVENVTKVECRTGSRWLEIEYGISPDDMLVYDSDSGSRSDPVIKWQWIDEQVEVWPIPASNGFVDFDDDGVTPEFPINPDYLLRFTGNRVLKPLLADNDTADLDDNLIVLFAAAEILASRKQADAEAKLKSAQTRLDKLMGRQAKSRRRVVVGGPISCFPHQTRILIPVWKP